MPPTPDVPLRTTRSPRKADEWALVLTSEGLPAAVQHGHEGYSLVVPAELAERAADVLARYEAENSARELAPRAERLPDWPGGSAIHFALAVSVAMVVFFVSVTGPRDGSVSWFALGSADAAKIVAGEWWRAITALTLHADLEHVLSNAVIGGFFVAWVLRMRGPGLGILLVVLAGVLGNLANAWLRDAVHVSVGASTSGFGAVGVLAGVALMHRGRGGLRGGRRWAPFAAGLGILAMFGSNEATDVWAHLFGFAAGTLLGAASAWIWRPPPGRVMQALLGAGALGLILLGWELALRPSL